MNPEAHGHGQHHLEDVFDDFGDNDNVETDVPSAETEIAEGEVENSPNLEDVESAARETPQEERLGDFDERLRLLSIEHESASRAMDDWTSSPDTNPADFQYKVPHMKIRLNSAEHAISSTKLDRELVSAQAETPEAADAVVNSFITGQVMEGKTKSQREGVKSIDSEEEAANQRLADTEAKIDRYQGILDGEIPPSDINVAELTPTHRRDLVDKVHQLSDRYEAALTEKMSGDFSGRREVLEAKIKVIEALGVSDEELPRTVQTDPDFAACLKEAEFNYSEDDEASKRAKGHDPEKEALALFTGRFPHKAEFYKRLQENSQAAESAPEQEAGSSPETSTPEMANEEELTGKLVPETIEEIVEAEPVTAEDSALERSWKQSEELGSHITGLDIEDPEMITQVEKVGGVKGDETVPIKMEESEKHSSERSKEGPPDPASVKEVMKRTGSFFVNTFSAHQMNGALPYLMDTSYDRVISVSTINPGKNFFGRVSGTYDKDGVILKGGIITSFDKEDSSTGKTGDVAVTSPSGMSTTTFSREGRGQKALNMMDKVAMRRVKHPKKHTSLAYNEFVVRQPQTFGYFESMEPGKDGKIILTHQDLDSFRKRFVEASGRNLPMFALMPDRTFVRVKSIGEDGELVLGETLKPEQVYSEEETNS